MVVSFGLSNGRNHASPTWVLNSAVAHRLTDPKSDRMEHVEKGRRRFRPRNCCLKLPARPRAAAQNAARKTRGACAAFHDSLPLSLGEVLGPDSYSLLSVVFLLSYPSVYVEYGY